jgi:segregation and condensation protein A
VPESGARVCEVSLDEFEGPLDLLLHLVRRHELDILDIPIAFVCEKYLAYIELMQAMDLEVAGDYLVMAATLAYLKSRELVPQLDAAAEGEVGEDGEVGPDPRQQLIMRLLEYQKYKEAADHLDARPIAGRDTFGRGGVVELPPVDAGLAPITLFRLAEAYQRVLDRARIHKSHEVVMETVSVAQRMEQLTTILIERGRFDFEQLFLERPWSSEAELRSVLVVTLMSILELVRMGVASVNQPLGSDVLLVERVASAEAAREALRGYDESRSYGDGRKDEPGAPKAADGEGSVPPDEGDEPAEGDALDWQTLLGAIEDARQRETEAAAAVEDVEAAEDEDVEAAEGEDIEAVEAAEGEDVEAAEDEDEDVEAAEDEDVETAEDVEAAEDEDVETAQAPAADDEALSAWVESTELDDIEDEVEAAEVEAAEVEAAEVEPAEVEAAEVEAAEVEAAEVEAAEVEAEWTEAGEAETALPDDARLEAARVTEPASVGDEASEATSLSAAPGGPAPDDAGALARSVVSESPPSPGVVDDAAGELAPAPPVDDGASESTEGDEEHGENGEAEAVEGS